MTREITFGAGRRPPDDESPIHIFGLPHRIGRAGPRARAVLRAALEAAWDRDDGVGVLDLDAHDQAARLDAADADACGDRWP